MRGPRARGGAAGARGGPGGAPESVPRRGPRRERPGLGDHGAAPLPPLPVELPARPPPPDSTSWTPCSRGPSARPPLPAPPRAAPLPPPLCARRRGRGRSSGPATPFTFVFCLWKRGDRSMRFRPIYVSTREQASVACVRFPCWFFFKEMGRRKKKDPAPSPPLRRPFFFFFLVLLCVVPLRAHIPVAHPGSAPCSVCSKSLRSPARLRASSLPPPLPRGGAWPSPHPRRRGGEWAGRRRGWGWGGWWEAAWTGAAPGRGLEAAQTNFILFFRNFAPWASASFSVQWGDHPGLAWPGKPRG